MSQKEIVTLTDEEIAEMLPIDAEELAEMPTLHIAAVADYYRRALEEKEKLNIALKRALEEQFQMLMSAINEVRQ